MKESNIDKNFFESLKEQIEMYSTDKAESYYTYASFWFTRLHQIDCMDDIVMYIEEQVKILLEEDRFFEYLEEVLIPKLQNIIINKFPIVAINLILYVMPLKFSELKEYRKRIKFELKLNGVTDVFLPELDPESFRKEIDPRLVDLLYGKIISGTPNGYGSIMNGEEVIRMSKVTEYIKENGDLNI